LSEANKFSENIALQYYDDAKFLPTSDQVGNKTAIYPLNSEQSGKGSSIYYECPKGITCSLKIPQTTTF
jgi:hypothetical protein